MAMPPFSVVGVRRAALVRFHTPCRGFFVGAMGVG